MQWPDGCEIHAISCINYSVQDVDTLQCMYLPTYDNNYLYIRMYVQYCTITDVDKSKCGRFDVISRVHVSQRFNRI